MKNINNKKQLLMKQPSKKYKIKTENVKMKNIKIGVLAILSGLRRPRLKTNAKNAENMCKVPLKSEISTRGFS